MQFRPHLVQPSDVQCIHPFCLAQKGEECGEFDITTGGRIPFLEDGKPAFHAERWASMEWDLAGQAASIELPKELIDKAAEDLI